MTRAWSTAERVTELASAARDGVELLIIGGGINGAGVLRDAATRGLGALVVERADFAAGTSSRSSKFVHGGLRYIGEGHLGLVREACRERDLLLELSGGLVEPVPFLFPAYTDSKLPLWQVRAALWIYNALSSLRNPFDLLRDDAVRRFSRDLRVDGLRGAGLYRDAQVDDARLVLETLKSARGLGAAAVNHAEVIELLRGDAGRVAGARVRDRLTGETHSIRALRVVNAAGPGVERVRGFDRCVERPELRPAKGVHLVIPRDRIHAEGAVTFEAPDGRHLFLHPFGDVWLIGTTDSFTDEIDEPVVTIEEVHYLLGAVNEAFPRVGLTTNDLCSVWAGVRPLAAGADEDAPPSSVSREERIYADPSGLLSVAGGKLTTYRAMAERIVDRIAADLPEERRRTLGPSRTRSLPLREPCGDPAGAARDLASRFDLSEAQAAHLVRSHGADAARVLESARPEWIRGIGASRFTLAEIAWALRTECAASLCDVLEHRVRLALFAVGQGLRELEEIADVAAEAAGWDAERRAAEASAYAAAVRRRYQIIAASDAEKSAA